MGAAILVPLRLLAAFPLLAISYLVVASGALFFNVTAKNNQRPRGKLYVLWQVGSLKILFRPLMWCLGITTLHRRKIKISDVIANYQPVRQTKGPAPIVVSNHTSWLDCFFYLMLNVSFLAKAPIAAIPFVGTFAVARQCIFLDRSSLENRNTVLNLIKQRAQRVASHNDISPLLIFPEGTVTNGRTLMNFKRGAFASGERIKICVLKYNTRPLEYVWSTSNITTIYSMFFGMSQLVNTVEFVEFEDDFDPHWVYATKNIDPNSESAWREVAKVVKSLMAFAGGLHCDETTHRNMTELELGWENLNLHLTRSISSSSK